MWKYETKLSEFTDGLMTCKIYNTLKINHKDLSMGVWRMPCLRGEKRIIGGQGGWMSSPCHVMEEWIA
jgi:hypothetical protein